LTHPVVIELCSETYIGSYIKINFFVNLHVSFCYYEVNCNISYETLFRIYVRILKIVLLKIIEQEQLQYPRAESSDIPTEDKIYTTYILILAQPFATPQKVLRT
jgi:hypothetical protein